MCWDYTPHIVQDCRHKNNSLVPSALHLPAASQCCVFLPASMYQSRPASLHVPASTLTVVDLTRPFYHTLQGWIVPLAHCEIYTSLLWFFIDLMFFCLSNRKINCSSLALTAHLIFCSMLWSALKRGPVAIKKLTALRPVSGEIYCNNQVVSGHGQGSYIWKYAMVIIIIGLLYKHWHSA